MMTLEQETARSRRVREVMERWGCDSEDAWRYLDYREEGYSTYQAALMAGLADPQEGE